MSVSPILKTTITKCSVSTSTKLRFYVKRELGVKGDVKMTRLALYDIFKSLCDQELNYQELVSDLSISCFCRTGVVNTSVILEADCDCITVQEHLLAMTLTTGDIISIGDFLSSQHSKTCLVSSCASVRKIATAQFMREAEREMIVKRVFEETLKSAQTTISPHMRQFGDKDFLMKMDQLSETLKGSPICVIHGNFTANHIALKNTNSTSCGIVLAFGSELSHLGHPTYDAGVFMAELLIWYYIHAGHPDSTCRRQHFCHTLKECVLQFTSTYFGKFDLFAGDSLISRFTGLAAGYAGVSMLFRTTGNDWNGPLPVDNNSVRDEILACALRLINGYDKVQCPQDVIDVAFSCT